MSTHPSHPDRGDPVRYEIRLRARLDDRWATWFEGMTLEPEPGGVTVLSGPLADQAALHGVLARLRDLGVPLISVGPAPDPPDDSPAPPVPPTRSHPCP